MRLLALFAAGCGFQARSAPLDGPRDVAMIDGARDAFDAATDGPTDGPIVVPIDARAPAIGFRQINNTEGSNLMTPAVTLGQPVAAGDLLVVLVGWYKTGTITSIGDAAGTTFVLASAPTASGTETQAVYYACGVAAAASETVTVHFATNNQDPDVRVLDYSGIAPAGCLDGAHANVGSGTAIDSGALATTTAHDLLVAGDFQVNMTTTPDPMFTRRQISGFGDLVEDRIVNATGTFTAHATESAAGAWVMQIAAFRGF